MTPVASATMFEGGVGFLTVAGLVLQQQGNAAAWAELSKCSIRRCSMEASCGFVQLSNPRCSSPVKAHLILPGQCLMPAVSKSLLRILQIVR